ncbi:E3 ubiquitin ligase subunit cullin [Encephalitozoon intestinalis ATCC 50506]|uniref:E3 ubiquitin ligase subunit cullin n=1 Tax=Encephalitozoon intestinalis (strain ATCC 50506) TaxID=876142 RepID=E0S809_ENCIT|nr:E3 ubiquitin ligase subunit cullin [Encephalitozoon intestinalis ATCC 50506]ADM11844.1 E3 ubiquitin ligase subunit cullin [Encephalitozoon intestinalis ATCC 50506]UTX45594.1 cullin-like protein [Encephalitozoon intestinalis]
MDIGRKPLSDEDFGSAWKSIEKELRKLSSGGLCSGLEIYNNIYTVCTSSTPRLENKLYWKIGDFVYMRAREIRKEVFEAKDWIKEYNEGFRKFRQMVFAIDELCDFLNECVKGRTMRDLGFLLWERCVLQQTMKYKHTTLGFELVNQERIEVIKDAIESFRLIVPDLKKPMLYYTQRYEQFALQKIGSKYQEEIRSMCGEVEKYSFYVREKIWYEKSIREKIFLEESWEKMEEILEEVFILNKREYLFAEIYKIMSMHRLPVEILDKISKEMEHDKHREVGGYRTNDFYELQNDDEPKVKHSDVFLERMSVLYRNLSGLKSACEIFREVFTRYVREESERHVDVYSKGIETLYIFHCMLRHVVDVGFLGDHEYFKILKREFSTSCMKLRPSLEARLLEFSDWIVGENSNVFRFLDREFEKNTGGSHLDLPFLGPGKVKEEGLELGRRFEGKNEFLRQVFGTLYKMIENKHVFYEMYLSGLGRRLLEKGPNLYEEKKLISLMKRKGNQDFIKKAETMVADINISLSYNKDTDRFVWVLTQAYWPQQAEAPLIRIPESLEMIKRVYDSKFNKKKLCWAWNLGSVCVEIYGVEIQMNVLQYSVIDLFNRHEQVDFEKALSATKMGTKVIGDVLKSLVDSGLLVCAEGWYRIGDIFGIEKDIRGFYCSESVSMVHEIDKNSYYQSLASRILKRRKRMCMDDIVKETQAEHTERFGYDEVIFSEAIRILGDKGIIEEVEDAYVYLP